jgi:hypothetical protein
LPTVSGTPAPGQQLTADPGEWDKPGPTSIDWMACHDNSSNCARCDAGLTVRCENIGSGAVYVVGTSDVGNTIRAVVAKGEPSRENRVFSEPTGVVKAGAVPPPVPPTTGSGPGSDEPPIVKILSTRFTGATLHLRMRVCDESRKKLTFVATDSKPGVTAYTHRFTLTPHGKGKCSTLIRSWLPDARFSHGRHTVTILATNKFGWTSKPAKRTLIR